MRLAAGTFCLLVLLPAWPALSAGSYLVGSISLDERENSDLYSAASVLCYNFWGNPSTDCLISGEHFIYDAETQEQISYIAFLRTLEYNDYLRTAPPENSDRCFRARVTGSIVYGSYSNYWTSPRKCVDTKPEIPDETCPILLDLDRDGYHLSGPFPPVSFDLNTDGYAEQLAWTAAGEGDAFLCRDRDGDGAIEDGDELFGTFTRLSTGEVAGSAFLALAELDQPELGGNADGFISALDTGFHGLCVWIDEDRDGRSRPGELAALSEAGVTRLGYDYVVTRRRDAHGNLFRFKATAWMLNAAGRERPWPFYDVFFATP